VEGTMSITLMWLNKKEGLMRKTIQLPALLLIADLIRKKPSVARYTFSFGRRGDGNKE
jgi:hypothetical protein